MLLLEHVLMSVEELRKMQVTLIGMDEEEVDARRSVSPTPKTSSSAMPVTLSTPLSAIG